MGAFIRHTILASSPNALGNAVINDGKNAATSSSFPIEQPAKFDELAARLFDPPRGSPTAALKYVRGDYDLAQI